MTGLKAFITAAGGLVNRSIEILLAVALLTFLFGLVKFIFKVGGDEGAVEEGRNIMTWGLIALFVMVSVWGILGLLQHELKLPNTATQNAPEPGILPYKPTNLPNSYEPFKPGF